MYSMDLTEFQYIQCYGSSPVFIATFVEYKYFNTSNVMVLRLYMLLAHQLWENFNTSNVMVLRLVSWSK